MQIYSQKQQRLPQDIQALETHILFSIRRNNQKVEFINAVVIESLLISSIYLVDMVYDKDF